MQQAFICDAVRTPFGRYGGALSALRADDLAALPLKALLARLPQLDPHAIDDVILGWRLELAAIQRLDSQQQ